MFLEHWDDEATPPIEEADTDPPETLYAALANGGAWADILRHSALAYGAATGDASVPAAIEIMDAAFHGRADAVSLWALYGDEGLRFPVAWADPHPEHMRRLWAAAAGSDDDGAAVDSGEWFEAWLGDVEQVADTAYRWFVYEVTEARQAAAARDRVHLLPEFQAELAAIHQEHEPQTRTRAMSTSNPRAGSLDPDRDVTTTWERLWLDCTDYWRLIVARNKEILDATPAGDAIEFWQDRDEPDRVMFVGAETTEQWDYTDLMEQREGTGDAIRGHITVLARGIRSGGELGPGTISVWGVDSDRRKGFKEAIRKLPSKKHVRFT
jgi:hypothetical protein